MRRNYTIDPATAFERYYALGARRSLKALATMLAGEGQGVPLRTLEAWSRRHDWQAQIARMDEEVGQRARQSIAALEAESRLRDYNVAEALKARYAKWALECPEDRFAPADVLRGLKDMRAWQRELVDADGGAIDAPDIILTLDLGGGDDGFVGEAQPDDEKLA